MQQKKQIDDLKKIAHDLLSSGLSKSDIENIIFSGTSSNNNGLSFSEVSFSSQKMKALKRKLIDNLDDSKPQIITDQKFKILLQNDKSFFLNGERIDLVNKNILNIIDDAFFINELNEFVKLSDNNNLKARKCILNLNNELLFGFIRVDKINLDEELYFLFEIINIQTDADFKSQFFEAYNNMQSLLNATTDTALLIDRNGIILETNETFAQNNGKRPEEILGTNVFELFDKKLAESRRKKVAEVFSTRQQVEFSDVRDGFYFNISLYPVKNEKGEVHRVAVFANDKTNEFNVLKRLKRSEERFRKFAEMLPQTVFETNKDNVLTFMNLNGLSTFEYTDDDIKKGVYIYDLVHPIEKKDAKTLLKNAAINLSSVNIKLNAITKNGKVIPVEVHVNSIVKDNKYDGMRGIVVNFSKQTEIEQALLKSQTQLQKSNQTKTKLFSILAHDLRGPFSGFINLSETLSTRLEEIKFQDMKDISGSLHISAINLYSLLDNLLSWARNQAGSIKVNSEIIDIENLLLEVINYYKLNIEQKNIKVNINVEKDVKTFADKNMIRTVLRNIFSNAIKFVDFGGTIDLNSFISNNNTIIKICDDGIGISQDRLRTLFDLKPMEYTSGTMNETGTGLGMNITKEFIDANNGILRVESIEGEGSAFTIILPTK